MITAEKALIKSIYDTRFRPGVTPRSAAYKQGVLHGLELRIYGQCPPMSFNVGTPEADAYFSGKEEGVRLAKNALEVSDDAG